jgi:hypothetical protein
MNQEATNFRAVEMGHGPLAIDPLWIVVPLCIAIIVILLFVVIIILIR